MVKISMKKFKHLKQIQTSVLQSGCPLSIVHDATIELPDSVNTGNNASLLDKNHVNVTLARPALINSSATQSQGAAIFPQK